MLTLIALGSAAAWLFMMAFITTTSKFGAAFIFKFLPFGIGVACLIAFLTEMGWVIPGALG